jgi:hypothetical protein
VFLYLFYGVFIFHLLILIPYAIALGIKSKAVCAGIKLQGGLPTHQRVHGEGYEVSLAPGLKWGVFSWMRSGF